MDGWNEGKFGHRNDIVAEGAKIDNEVEHGSCMYHISLWEIMRKKILFQE